MLLVLILAGFVVGNSAPYFAISHIRKGKDFHFPILNSRRNPRVETKINQLLQLSELRALADPERKAVFEQVTINDGSLYGRKVSIFYHVYSNNPRTLSIGFDNTADGATTHWWVSYYNFNAQNGDLISLRDLFSDVGYEKFVDLIVKQRSIAYRSEVTRKVKPNERDAFLSVLGSIERDELSDFVIEARSITIDGENLLGKSLCCENLNMKVRFDLRVFQHWLNAYGRIIFGVESGNLAKFRSDRLPQLFKGTVGGKAPFVALLNVTGVRGSKEVEGVYAYLKYRKGIYLTGTLENNAIQLTEHVLVKTEMNFNTDSNHRFVDGGSISGIFDLSALKGVWIDKHKEKSMIFVASRE